jgi:hypothetical protein
VLALVALAAGVASGAATAEVLTQPIEARGPAATQVLGSARFASLGDALNRELYSVRRSAGLFGPAFVAENDRHNYGARFDNNGVTVFGTDGDRWRVNVQLAAYGFDGAMRPVERPMLHPVGTRMELRRGSITEWFENGPGGVRQWFRVAERPGAMASGPLRLILDVQGLRPEGSGDAIRLLDGAGATALTYSNLKVWDAQGLSVDARMRAAGDAIVIEVDEAAAVYPLTIDPVFEDAFLFDPSGAASDQFGFSVAIDGNTAAVGARLNDTGANDAGLVVVFVRDANGVWQVQQRIANPQPQTSDWFGYDVDVIGNTLIVGEPLDDQQGTDAGRVHIYERSGSSWGRIDSFASPFGNASGNRFGWSLSADGNVLGVGAPFYVSDRRGSAHVFRRSGPGSAYGNIANFDGSSFIGTNVQFGADVAINQATSTFVVGTSRFSSQNGAGFISWFRGSNFESFFANDQAASPQTNDQFGNALAFSGTSATTATLVVGQHLYDASFGDQGRVEIWEVTSGGSRNRLQLIENPNPASSDWFGYSVAVTDNRLVVGAPLDDVGGTDRGAVYAYTRSGIGSTFGSPQTLQFASIQNSDNFGWSVDIDRNVNTPNAIYGAFVDDNSRGVDAGSAIVFVVNRPPTLQTIPDLDATERTLATFTAVGSDNDPGQSLTYSLRGTPPAGASIDASTGVFTWTPSETQGGSTGQITVRVTDNGNPPLFAERTFNFTVAETNEAPVLAPIPDRNVNEGTQLSVTAVATDEDDPAQTLTFSLQGTVPQGAQINSATGVFTWTPSESQGPGSFPITVRVTDNGNPARSAERTFTVTVNEVNVAPELDAIGNRTAREEEPLIFTATATDVDVPANTLSFSLVGAPTGASIDPVTGGFRWTPTEAQGPGQYTFTVRVADNGSPIRTDDEQITVTVLEVEQLQVDLNGRYFAPNGAATASTADLGGGDGQVIAPSGAAEASFTPFADGVKVPRALVADLRNRMYRYDVEFTGTWATSGDSLSIVAGDPQAGGVVQTFGRVAAGFRLTQASAQFTDNTGATRFRVLSFFNAQGDVTTTIQRLNGSEAGTTATLAAQTGNTVNSANFRVTIAGNDSSIANATISNFSTSANPTNAIVTFAANPFAQVNGTVDFVMSVSGLAQPVSGYQAFMGIGSGQQFVTGQYGNFPFSQTFDILDNMWPNLAAGISFSDQPTSAEGKLADIRLRGIAAGTATLGFRSNNPPTRFTDNDGNSITPTLIASNTVVYESIQPTVSNVRLIGQRTGNDNLVGGNADTGQHSVTVTAVDGGSVVSGLASRPTITVQFSSGAPVPLNVFHVSGNDYRGLFTIGKTTPNGPATITVVATDDSGNVRTTVSNFNVSQAQVVITLSVQGLQGNVTRATEFVVGGTGGQNEALTLAKRNVSYSDGNAVVILDQTDGLVRGSAYTRVSARDPLHTLWRTVNLNAGPDPDQFAATLSLKSGDATNDNIIDVRDYGVVAGRFGQNIGRDTPENFNGNRHPDFDGNGLVGTIDVTFVTNQDQFLSLGDAPAGGFGRPDVPLKRATIQQMKDAGVINSGEMDLDRDGWVTFEEITQWLKRRKASQ